jgi:hypothetical protein
MQHFWNIVTNNPISKAEIAIVRLFDKRKIKKRLLKLEIQNKLTNI